MTTDQLDEFEPKEQSKAASPTVAAPARATIRTTAAARGTGLGNGSGPAATQPKRMPPGVPAGVGAGASESVRARVSIAGRQLPSEGVGFLAAFAVGSVAVLFLFFVVAMGFSGGGNKTITGISVGSVDVSGLTRDELVDKLKTSYAYLSQGEITVTTPVGSDTVHFTEAGRSPDVEAMADAAMSIGHTGNPLSDAVVAIRSALFRESVPVVVKLDPTALAQRVHKLVGAGLVESKNAVVTVKTGAYTFTPSQVGRGIDEGPLCAAIIDQLVLTSPAAGVQTDATFVDLPPQVNDNAAQEAIVKAQKMTVDVKLTWGDKTWTVPAATIKGLGHIRLAVGRHLRAVARSRSLADIPHEADGQRKRPAGRTQGRLGQLGSAGQHPGRQGRNRRRHGGHHRRRIRLPRRHSRTAASRGPV